MSLSPILTSAAFAPIQNVGWIRVTGSDRIRWLNGMATNNIQALKPGEGNYNFFLNAQGRIHGDATIFLDPQPIDELPRESDCLWLQTALDQRDKLIAALDHFIIMDDVTLTPIDDMQGVLILGQKAESLLQRHFVGVELPPEGSPAMTRHCDVADDVMVIRAHAPLVPRFEFWSEPYAIDGFLKKLHELRVDATPATAEDLEQLRILEGTPLYGIDIRNTETAKDLPQETAQTRALHFTKGCYLGQEIVERIRSRGNVHRTFYGFILTGDLTAPGTILTSEDKPVGELTSATCIELPTGPLQIALGYIRREVLDRGTTITYPGGTATPSALPFQLPESRA